MLIPFLHSVVRRQLRRQGVESKQILLNGQSFHYNELSPENPIGVLVLIHGLGTSSSTWVNILPHIGRYRILAPDLPGFGLSPAPETVPTIDRYVTMMENFLDAVVKGSFSLLGHSMGGWITMKYALAHRDRVNHLLLVNTAGIYYQGVDKLRDAFILRSTKDTRALLDLIWVKYPWYFRPFTPFIFEDLVSRNVPEIVSSVREEDFVNSDLHRMTMPVSVIWGLGDRLISPEALKILEEKLPARRIYTIPGCGHVPQLQAPGKLLSILHKVLHESIV
jgi:pimeloyl-ACP methyl ester carboxylesterase